MPRPFKTPDDIKAKALDVLRQLDGLSFADACYALDVARSTMDHGIALLHEREIFKPPVFHTRQSD